MQIQCPECGNAMSAGAIKPGRYQPKCKKCGKPFAVIVEGDPPTIKVGKLKIAPAPAIASSPALVPQQSQATNVDATLVSTTQSRAVPAVEATMDSETTQVVNATTPQGPAKVYSAAKTQNAINKADVTRQHAIDATQDGSSGGGSSGPVRKGGSQVSGSQSMSVDADAVINPRGMVPEIPEKLGGYRILRLLGKGAMGAVYEAKQLSLDRNVALKTIRGRIADNPSSLARFTREAYAAAQLVHHNVVQIYDFGQDAGQHYFSMEWVRGGPLSDLVRDRGPFDPKVAATYTLQAARGLQFAHRHGMVHRDVKPANLLLNDEGVVKVADLGLVKVPDQPDPQSDVGAASASSGMASGTQVTMMGTAVGTPAYMAPEQGVDSTTVDHRADVYSLGCSLFYFLTGKPPFDGQQVSVVMQQHAQAPIPKIQSINARVPEPLAKIVERSMAKRPEDRYASLAEMIADLESFLGLQSAQGFSPTSQQADRWESLAKTFASAPLAKLERPAFAALTATTVVLLLLTAWLGFAFLPLAPSFFKAAIFTAIFLGNRISENVLITRIRSWLGSISWFDYLVGGVVSLVLVLGIFLVGMWPGLLLGLALGAIAGAVYHFAIRVPLHASRLSTLQEAEKFVRDLRIEGIDEDRLRDFAARYSGRSWKPLFEAVFGYDASLRAREQLLVDPVTKSLAGGRSIRDWLCAKLQAKTEQNHLARDHKRLALLEEKGLKSEGMTDAEAKERAWQMASAMIDASKLTPAISSNAIDPKVEAEQRRNRMKAMLAEARSGRYAKKRDKLAPLRLALSGKMRLLAGSVLLAMFGFWVYRTGLVSQETIQKIQQTAASGTLDPEALQSVQQEFQNTSLPTLLGTSGFAVGIAGLLMAGSAFISGWKMSLFAIPAVIIAIFGTAFGIPDIGPVPGWAVACVGAFVLLIPGALISEAGSNEY
jgi:eukaryotic-like serine/threonine-protein kinase